MTKSHIAQPPGHGSESLERRVMCHLWKMPNWPVTLGLLLGLSLYPREVPEIRIHTKG